MGLELFSPDPDPGSGSGSYPKTGPRKELTYFQCSYMGMEARLFKHFQAFQAF
jgi:hypothetical protein